MPEYRNLFCVPNRSFPDLDFPPTYPLDLDGPYTAITAPGFSNPSATAPGHPLGFPAGQRAMIHRNWKPFSWDIFGGAQTGFRVQGLADRPGPVTPDTEFLEGESTVIASVLFDGLFGHPRPPQPDFGDPSNPRTMINWRTPGDGAYPDPRTEYITGAYPVLLDETGSNATACYIGATFAPYASIQPYFWHRNETHYLEHDIRLDISFAYYFTPGSQVPESWFLDEGQNVNWVGSSSASLNEMSQRVLCGSVAIQDTTGVDPEHSWGSVSMYQNPDTIPFPVNLTLRVRSNYLKIPGYD